MADKKEIKLIVKTEIDKAIKDFKKLEKQAWVSPYKPQTVKTSKNLKTLSG